MFLGISEAHCECMKQQKKEYIHIYGDILYIPDINDINGNVGMALLFFLCIWPALARLGEPNVTNASNSTRSDTRLGAGQLGRELSNRLERSLDLHFDMNESDADFDFLDIGMNRSTRAYHGSSLLPVDSQEPRAVRLRGLRRLRDDHAVRRCRPSGLRWHAHGRLDWRPTLLQRGLSPVDVVRLLLVRRCGRGSRHHGPGML